MVFGFEEEIDVMEWWLRIVMYFIMGSGFILCIVFKKIIELGDIECELDYDLEEGISGMKVEWRIKLKRRIIRVLSWLVRFII